MINQLRYTPAGHQYFDLATQDATLMVSVGEYDAAWWHWIDHFRTTPAD